MADAAVLLYKGKYKAVKACLGLNMTLKRDRTSHF